MRHNVLLLLISGFCIVVAACSNDTSSLDSAQSKSGSVTSASTPKIGVAPWNGSLQDAGKTDLCALDTVNGQKAANGSFEVTSSQPVTFEGWVSTSDLHNPGSFSIVLRGTNSFGLESNTGLERNDVAQAYKTSDLVNAGYKAELSALPVPTGSYAVLLVHEEKGAKFACDPKLNVTVK